MRRVSVGPSGCPAVAQRWLDGRECELQRVAKRSRGADLSHICAKLDESPRHIRRDSRDDTVASHQPGCLRDPDKVICHGGVNGHHATDIHDEDTRAAISNPRQRFLHDVLSTL